MSAPKTEQALATIKSKLGVKLGSGQCYGLTAYYSQLLGGCNLGGGINTPNPDGNGRQEAGSDTRRGMSASNIGGDYNWSAKGWAVKFDPSMTDLKTGCIVNYKPTSGNIWGHTAVITRADGTSYDVLEQNYNYKQYVTERTGITVTSNIASIIYTPELVQGGIIGGTIEPLEPSTPTGTGDIQTRVFDVEAMLIDVDSLTKYTPNVYTIPNLLQVAHESIENGLRGYTGKQELEVELQLLNSEFLEVELYDIYGNSYIYQPQYLPKTLERDFKYQVVSTGSMGDSNQVHISLLRYNNSNNPSYLNFNIFDNIDTNNVHPLWQQANPEHFKYGFNDITGRNLAILNDAEASYIQSNKNQMEATQLSFKENRDLLKQSIDLANKKVTTASNQASYNAQFSVESANLNMFSTGISAVGGVLGNMLSGNIGGAISGGISGGFNTYNAMRGLDNAKMQQGFTDQTNQLNKQSNALSNMQAKIGLDQSIRAYNASMADLQNQPVTVQQIGNDLSFQSGNLVSDVYWRVGLAQLEVLYRANQYIKMYGVITNTFSNNVLSVLNERKRFNYIKMISINLGELEANQSHLASIQAILQSGVRIWNYKHIKEETTLYNVDTNNPNN